MHDARLRGEPGMFRRRLRRGEVDHRLGADEQFQRIGGDGDAQLADPRELADIRAEHRRALRFRAAGNRAVRHFVKYADDSLAHPAGRSHYCKSHGRTGLAIDEACRIA